MKQIFGLTHYALILMTLFSGKALAADYCQGHPRKIVLANKVEDVQAVLNGYNNREFELNGRIEVCLQITPRNEELQFTVSNQKLTLTNNTDKEVVIGFLKARRTDDSTIPILEIRGRNVTVFAPEIGNAKKAFKLFGVGHKIIDGTINGVANVADSPCVSGNTSKSEIKNLTINNCTNAINLSGNGNSVEGVTIVPHLQDYTKGLHESDGDYQARILVARPMWPSGTCLFMSGQSGLIKGVFLDKCYGVGIQILGSGFRIESSQMQGELEFERDKTRYSTDCLLIKKSSAVIVETNEISNCHKGIHIEDSQQIAIGPELLADFDSKHNKLHHNDYAVHAEFSQQVFAWHNSVYENGIGLPVEETDHFGMWSNSTNYLESVLLKSPTFESVDKILDANLKEVPVVNYSSGIPFIEVNVPCKSGLIEFAFPAEPDNPPFLGWYQPHAPFTDCAFDNVIIGADGFGKARCPIQVTEENKDKRVISLVHINEAGSSPITKTLGIINDLTGPLVSAPASDAGNMTAEAAQSSSAGSSASGEVIAAVTGGGGGGVSGGGGGGAKMGSCALNAEAKKFPTEFFPSFIIIFTVLVFWRNRYGVG